MRAAVAVMKQRHIRGQLSLLLADNWNVIEPQTADFLHALKEIGIVRADVIALAISTAGQGETI